VAIGVCSAAWRKFNSAMEHCRGTALSRIFRPAAFGSTSKVSKSRMISSCSCRGMTSPKSATIAWSGGSAMRSVRGSWDWSVAAARGLKASWREFKSAFAAKKRPRLLAGAVLLSPHGTRTQLRLRTRRYATDCSVPAQRVPVKPAPKVSQAPAPLSGPAFAPAAPCG
jgi:hypothetical protein